MMAFFTMPTLFPSLLRSVLVAGLLCPLLAQADGLSVLKEALARYAATTPVKGLAEAKTWKRDGEGKEAEEKSGQASVAIDESAQGLRVHYARDTLTRLTAEEQARERDAKAKTPILSGLSALNTAELRQLANAAPALSRLLEKSVFKSEREEAWNGKPARLLHFDLGIGALSEKDRKYVKKYDGSLDVWIAQDGTPLASRTHQSLSGRAYVVISLDMTYDEEVVYAPQGDRLLATRKDTRSKGSGAGERSEARTIRSLLPQS